MSILKLKLLNNVHKTIIMAIQEEEEEEEELRKINCKMEYNGDPGWAADLSPIRYLGVKISIGL